MQPVPSRELLSDVCGSSTVYCIVYTADSQTVRTFLADFAVFD